MVYYVDGYSVKESMGTKEAPFHTIQEAADIAEAGDEVLALPGIYREAVNPIHGGTEKERIVYRSVEPLAAHITGAESVKDWTKEEGSVWSCLVDNKLFGAYNPYANVVCGDWYDSSEGSIPMHMGDVYLNEKSMYEVSGVEEVKNPPKQEKSWDSEFTKYVWYAVQDTKSDQTKFYANFQGLDPNRENVEICARRSCFAPAEEGIGYITLSGFKVSKAATQWAPPTAYQEGMIAPHWSKGWIIEDCEVYESKCVGISLGKYLQEDNENKWTKWKYKDGAQTERECIFEAIYHKWTKEYVGSHVIRRCHIHDCGAAGIAGQMGGVFSVIEDNHVHHINNKQNLRGAEVAGIKLHAALDVQLKNNHIHHCTRGLWLDWEAQGTRITNCLFHDNVLAYDIKDVEEDIWDLGEDIFVEVSHGPVLIDHNFLLSERAVKIAAQGIAMVHNVIAGSFGAVGRGTDNGAPDLPSPRYTPYHRPHSTEIFGSMTILHGDMQFYNNIFVQQKIRDSVRKVGIRVDEDDNQWDDGNLLTGLQPYDSYPTKEEWEKQFEGYCGQCSAPSNRYYNPLPVRAAGNIYYNGAKPWSKESDALTGADSEKELKLEHRADGWYVNTQIFEDSISTGKPCLSTADLDVAFEPEERFENPDGSQIVFDTDYFGNKRQALCQAGPLEYLDREEKTEWLKVAD